MSVPYFRKVGKVTVQCYHNALPVTIKGKAQDPVQTPFTVQANVQNGGFSQTLLLPDSERTKDSIVLYTTSELRQAKEGSYDADTVLWQGDTYKVMRVMQFCMGVLDHYEAIAVREQLVK